MSKYDSATDIDLLERIKSSDKIAFEELYNRYSHQMTRYIIKVIQSEDEAMDIVQEVFISIWNRRETIAIQTSIAAYLMRAVRNLSIRYIEKNITKENFLTTLIDATERLTPSIISSIELKELESQIQEAVDKLPEKMREIFYLSRFENLNYLEIADRLGISDTTVKKQIHNALKRLKTQIGDDKKFGALIIGIFWISHS